MAQTTTSSPQQGVNMPAVDLRQMFGAGISAEGVRTSADLAVTQRAAGANMSVDVAAGSAAIQDDHATGGGFYAYTLATATNVAVGAADGTNPRVDRVVIRIRDAAYGDASNDSAPFVVAGTPTTGATLANTTGAAAVPGSCLLLANVLVPTSSTSVTTANIDSTGASNNSPKVRPVLLTLGSAKQTVSAWSGGPPASPADQDVWIATAVDANGTRWQFQYNAGSGSTYKWEFVGGTPVYVTVATAQGVASTSYVDLATAGPSFALGRGGDYSFGYFCQATAISATNITDWMEMAYALSGGTTYAASDNDAAGTLVQAANFGFQPVSAALPARAHTSIAASTTITAKYRNVSGAQTVTIANRRLTVIPARII